MPIDPNPPDRWQKWFEDIWAYREETLYRQWFGDIGSQIYTLTPDLFKHLGVKDPDSRWLHHGIFACPPDGSRTHWAYITSGLSNPWGQDPDSTNPKEFSGLGMELVLLTPRELPAGVGALSWLSAVILLVAAGRIRGDLPEKGDRVPLGTSLDAASDSPLRHLILSDPPAPLPAQFELASGVVDLVLCTGITDAERDFARAHDSAALLEKLQQAGASPLTDTARHSVI